MSRDPHGQQDWQATTMQSDPRVPRSCCQPTLQDVLLGRGKGNQRHKGNVDFLRKIDNTIELYERQARGRKQHIVKMIIEWVRERNGNFLRQTFDGNWVKADEPTVEEKVSQAFRHRKRLYRKNLGGKSAIFETERIEDCLGQHQSVPRETPASRPPSVLFGAPNNLDAKPSAVRDRSSKIEVRDQYDGDASHLEDSSGRVLAAQQHAALGMVDQLPAGAANVLLNKTDGHSMSLKQPSRLPRIENIRNGGDDQQLKRMVTSWFENPLPNGLRDPSASDEIVSDEEILKVIRGWEKKPA